APGGGGWGGALGRGLGGAGTSLERALAPPGDAPRPGQRPRGGAAAGAAGADRAPRGGRASTLRGGVERAGAERRECRRRPRGGVRGGRCPGWGGKDAGL